MLYILSAQHNWSRPAACSCKVLSAFATYFTCVCVATFCSNNCFAYMCCNIRFNHAFVYDAHAQTLCSIACVVTPSISVLLSLYRSFMCFKYGAALHTFGKIQSPRSCYNEWFLKKYVVAPPCISIAQLHAACHVESTAYFSLSALLLHTYSVLSFYAVSVRAIHEPRTSHQPFQITALPYCKTAKSVSTIFRCNLVPAFASPASHWHPCSTLSHT